MAETRNVVKAAGRPLLLRYAALVRWAFHRLYREFAWSYNGVAWAVSGGLWREWVLAALPHLRGRVLELGSGTGYLQEAMAARGDLQAAGLDASPQMLAIAGRRLRRGGHRPRLLRGDALQLPVARGAVDTVVATFPAEYILSPLAAAEIVRALAPGGRLVIVDGAQLTRDGPYERAVDAAFRATLQGSTREPALPPHLRALEAAGLAFELHWAAVGQSRVMVLVGARQEEADGADGGV